jgi:ketosteroid isomerase-like protein
MLGWVRRVRGERDFVGRMGYVHEQENLQTIHQIYAAFGEGDIEGVLGMLTDDVRWSTPGPPMSSPTPV